MIKCVITIKEVPGKGYYVNIDSEQGQATPVEMHVASCIRFGVDAVGQYLVKEAGKGQMFECGDADTMREIARQKIKEFEGGSGEAKAPS